MPAERKDFLWDENTYIIINITCSFHQESHVIMDI